MQPVTIIMTTYAPTNDHPRVSYAIQVLDYLRHFLAYPGPIHLHIADDGSPPEYVPGLIDYARALGYPQVSSTNAARNGIGASLNLAVASLPSDDDIWMYITDDWLLTRALDITNAVRLITDQRTLYDYVRLGPTHPRLHCEVAYEMDLGFWLHLQQFHDNGYYFATRPFLATKQFWQYIGPFQERVDAYVTERDYSDRVNKSDAMLAEIGDLNGPWQHIGEVQVGKIQFPSKSKPKST
jgi:hypothetical protein